MHRFIAVTLFILSPSLFAADSGMQPGLWEVNASSDLLALAQQIPPDQMQGLGNLARQYGFQMPVIKNGAATSDVCITPDMATRQIPPSLYSRESGCEVNHATRNGNRLNADLVCSGADIQGEGKTEAIFDTPKSFSGTTTFKGTVRGVPIDDRAATSGRWIAANCTEAKSAR
jgi:hypothetical protein